MHDNTLPKDLIPREWIKKAYEDELMMRSFLKHRDAPASGVAFHGQQMVEKLLKSYLVQHRGTYPKIHPLDTLWELCRDVDSSFDEIKEDAVLLTSFYGPTRYPGDTPELTWPEAEQALAAALRIKEFVLGKIK